MSPSQEHSRGVPAEHFNLVDRLHTDVLEDRYGAIRASVLRHDDTLRAAHLLDLKGISRTFAVTLFSDSGHEADIARIDEVIRTGKPIGQTFREHGFAIRKNVLDVDILELPTWLRDAFRTESTHAKARYSEFLTKKDNLVPRVYGIVVEIYHPDFRSPEVNAVDRMQEAPTVSSLLEQGVSLDEVWKRLESGVPYDRADSRYTQAFMSSRRQVFHAEERIGSLLRSGISKG